MITQKNQTGTFSFVMVLIGILVTTVFSQTDLLEMIMNKRSPGSSESTDINNIDIQSQQLKDDYNYLDKYVNLEKVIMLDKSINDSLYYLGSNDVLTIYILGKINKDFIVIVNSEGWLMIPGVGGINVKRKTLAEGKKLILEKLAGVFKEKEILIYLTQLRQFKVYILGDVNTPGFYQVNGATRVSDLIVFMRGAVKEAPLMTSNGNNEIIIDNISKLRAIEIENDFHPKRYADLALFYNSNIAVKNPYLFDGDRVYIPKKKDAVAVFGAVNYPGEYNFMPGDSLVTLLNVAGGLARGADSSKIILSRFVNNQDSLSRFEFSLGDASSHNFPIEKDDRILACYIPTYRVHRQVTIKGEVTYPGIYPIKKDKTRLKEVISAAGGLTEDADLRGSGIIRRKYNKADDREYLLLKTLPIENLSPLERNYLKTKRVEETGKVSLDFEELFAGDNDLYNIILRDDDEIIIERRDLSVKVMGAVVSPGLVSYKEGAGIAYYIDQAGGFTSEAQRSSIRVIKGGTQTWIRPHRVNKLETGDVIWIPEKPYVNKLMVTKDVLLVLGSIATLIISAITIQRLADPK